MGLTSALFSSVSGLDTTSTAITVIGDNIANVNTPGFKERRPEFSDVLGQSIASVGGSSQLGAGARVARVSTIFTQGTFESSGKSTDLAIEGQGFFIVQGNQGRFLTRAGLFNFDNQGFFVNPEGLRVQGFGIDPQTGLSNGQIGDIQISSSIAPPKATETVEMSINLDSGAPAIGPSGSFDPSEPNTSSNFRTVVTVFDSLGNSHPATVFFTKLESPPDNTWETNVALATDETNIPPLDDEDDFVIQPPGNVKLTFNTEGVLTDPLGSIPVTFEFAGGGAPVQEIGISFGTLLNSNVDPTTQYAAKSTTNAFIQDGFAPGTLQGTIIDREGFITGQFSNGESIPLAQLALANFANVEALQAVGNNRLLETRQSGQALIGPAESGTLGSVRSSTLEQSNVDLATQFVKLIINQRAFQANTRTISVTNELLANLNSLGQ